MHAAVMATDVTCPRMGRYINGGSIKKFLHILFGCIIQRSQAQINSKDRVNTKLRRPLPNRICPKNEIVKRKMLFFEQKNK